jgi:hypothetical protein
MRKDPAAACDTGALAVFRVELQICLMPLAASAPLTSTFRRYGIPFTHQNRPRIAPNNRSCAKNLLGNALSSMHWLKRFSEGLAETVTQPSGFEWRDLTYWRPASQATITASRAEGRNLAHCELNGPATAWTESALVLREG